MRTEERRLRNRIEALEQELLEWKDRANHDGLTGLLRREALLRVLDDRKQQGSLSKICTVMILDVDHFKQVNDTHGHEVGDRLLQALGACLGNLLPQNALAARIGGEEFAVILEGSPSATSIYAQIMLAEFKATELPLACGSSLRSTMSIGVAEWNTDTSLFAAVAGADAALYAAKRAGRNRVHHAA